MQTAAYEIYGSSHISHGLAGVIVLKLMGMFRTNTRAKLFRRGFKEVIGAVTQWFFSDWLLVVGIQHAQLTVDHRVVAAVFKKSDSGSAFLELLAILV